MKYILNSKIWFDLLEDSKQPKKTIFTPNAEMLKLGKVKATGSKVEEVKVGDIITLYVNSIHFLNEKEGFCTEREVVFRNGLPQKGKVHIKEQENVNMTSFNKAKVVKSSSEDVEEGDVINYKNGQSHILPDNTEIISESQIYFKELD